MPTGYTSDIYDGKDISFKDFVLQCARAFGACINQRDEDMRVKPKKQKLDSYHLKELIKAKKELSEFNKKTIDNLKIEFENYKKNTLKQYEDSLSKRSKLADRYKKYIELSEKWNPPTSEHQGLKNFIINQLQESLNFDCGGDYYNRSINELNNLKFEKWLADKKEMLEKDVIYHKDGYEKDVKRIKEQNKWINELYKSLK